MTLAQTKAVELWLAMNESERHGCKYGLFPYASIQEGEKAGVDSKALCVALMDIASQSAPWRT